MQALQDFSAAMRRAQVLWQRLAPADAHWLTRPLAAFGITRLIVFVSGYLADLAIPNMTDVAYWHALEGNMFLDVWARWDSGFYLGIAQNGYSYQIGQQSPVAFFPVYPLLTRLFTPLTGNTVAAGWLVSNLALFGILILLYQLTLLEFGDRDTATRTVFYLAAFPTAFFFSAVYTESVFLLLVLGAMYFGRRRLWGWAGVFGMLAAATRIVGVIMWGVVGLEWLKVHGWTLSTLHRREAWQGMWRGLRSDWRSLLSISMIPLGLFTYMLFLYVQFGDPVAFSTVQSAWGRQMLGPVTIILNDIKALAGGNFLTGAGVWWHVIVDLTAFFAVLVAVVPIWRRLGESYALYSLISMVIPASSATQSLSRYALVVFPFFMMLGLWGKHVLLDRLLTIAFSVFLGIFTAIFVNWLFIA